MAKAKEEQIKQMKPTLVIGLGGTGQKVLVELKARFIREFGQVPRAVELLAFDTDTNKVVEAPALEGHVQLTPGLELHDIGNLSITQIARHLPEFPAWPSWFRDEMGQYPMEKVGGTVMRVRSLGRLAFFWHVGEIYNSMLAAVGRLTRLELEAEKRGINVFIITSVCGGTGSGIFLDMTYLIRHTVGQSNISESVCNFNGILVLPSVFPGGDSADIQSNAFAALAELDYLMDNPSWNVDYGSQSVNRVTYVGKRPFDTCYLIDSRNENGQGLQGVKEIVPMIVQAVYLQVDKEMANAMTAVIDSALAQVLNRDIINQATGEFCPTAYSGMGTAATIFPADKIIEYCANKLNVEIIADDFLKPAIDQEAVLRAVDRFLEANQLDAHTLPGRLAGDAQNKPHDVSIHPGQLDNVEYNDLIRAVDAIAIRADNTLDNELSPMLERNRGIVLAQLRQALMEEAERMVDDRTHSLAFVDAFLFQLGIRLALIYEKLDREVSDLENRRNWLEENRRGAYATFEENYTRGRTGRGKKKTRDAGIQYLNEVQSDLEGKFDVSRRAAAAFVLSDLTDAVQEQRRRIQSLIERLRHIEQQFRSTIDRIISEDHNNLFVQEITDRADIERYYQEYKTRGSVWPVTDLADLHGPFSEWLDGDQETISKHLLTFSRELFRPISEISVESVVLEKDRDQSSKRLRDLIERSVPFWSYRKAGVLEHDWKSQKIVVVGVEEKEESIFRSDIQIDEQLTSTFDKHRIVALQTSHGLPLFALAQYEQYRAAHDDVMQRNLKPLYVLPEVRIGGHKAKQVFALGIIFGEIFASGAFCYAKPENEGDALIRLGQDMVNSMQYLGSDNELSRALRNRIDGLVQQMGREQASAQVKGWIAAPTIDEHEDGAGNENLKMIKKSTIGTQTYISARLVAELRELMKVYIRDVLEN